VIFVHQVLGWKQEWTVPHRLLQKRLLMSPGQRAEYHKGPAGDNVDCHYEWLVKWRGLNYEHVTWELENSSFLNSPEGRGLIRDYESRHRKSELTSSVDKVAPETRLHMNYFIFFVDCFTFVEFVQYNANL
jgi:chromodomain-helicase-DNA-binding protein 3